MREADSIHLPLHLRLDPEKSASSIQHDGTSYRKKFPESLHFASSNFHMRSRTASTRSSISSAHIPDSATAYSPSTLASPLSSSYASDIQERFACHTLDGSRPPSRIRHGHRPSIATCSTFINDDDESPVYVGYQDVAQKIKQTGSDNSDPVETHEIEIDEPETDATPIKEEDDALTPGKDSDWEQNQTPCASPTQKSDISFNTFGDTVSSDDADGILDYTLQLVYGIELSEAQAPSGALHQVVSKFVQELGQHIWQAPLDGQSSQTMSGSSSSTTPSTGAGGDGSHSFGKRKKQSNGEDGGEDLTDGEGSGYIPSKRIKPSPKEDENLRLSCPYRKRNPHRFNVRDHHSCAMTYFPKFAELRQHIVKQHKRDDPSAFVCDRCTRDFRTRKELRDHQRQPKEHMCDISDHDPEAGIDGPTSNKLLSRKRVSGASPEVQWKEIWNILFPDDDDNLVRSYHFTPVIEHFELSAHYLEAFNYLQSSLRDKISNPATLETLATKFHQCFIETVERCVLTSQSMPYTNRSNKRNEPSRIQGTQILTSRKSRGTASRPDSGVVIDDTSEESGSIVGSSSLGHRDSVRTVRSYAGRRGSNIAPKGNPDMFPTPVTTTAGLNQSPPAPLPNFTFGASTNNMAHATAASVEEWANGLSFNQNDGTFTMADHWMADTNMTPQAEFGLDESLLYQASFCTIDDTFTNLHGTRTDGNI
ncbi:zinc finger domain-containing protein, partial [Metarhizium majus ARSEF 297]